MNYLVLLAGVCFFGYSQLSYAGRDVEKEHPGESRIKDQNGVQGVRAENTDPCSFSKNQKAPELRSWKDEYTACADSLIENNETLLTLTQNQVGGACPKYSTLSVAKRKLFLIGYLQEWAKLESGARYDAKVERVVSGKVEVTHSGLFKLQISDCDGSNNQGSDNFIQGTYKLSDPAISLKCAVSVMNQMVSQTEGSLLPSSERVESFGNKTLPNFIKFNKAEVIENFQKSIRITIPECF